MPDNLYYTQKVRGFQQKHVEYSKEKVVIELKRTKHRCPKCGSVDVHPEVIGTRKVRGETQGACREVLLYYQMHRIYCHKCHERSMEHIPFISHPKARLTKAFERTLIEVRQHMSLRSVSNYFKLRWHTVKVLARKFSNVSMSHVKMVGGGRAN